MATPILDLKTFIERPTVAIDGTPYELRNVDELSLLEYQRIAGTSRRLESIKTDEMTDDEAAELSALADQICRMILVDVPADVHDALHDTQRMAVLQAFITLPRTAHLFGGRVSPGTVGTRTGASSSRGSRASTAGARSSGSRARRSRSSGRAS